MLLAAALTGDPAGADQNDPRLPELFERLAQAPDDVAAQRIEGTIWGIWAESEDTAVSLLMQDGVAALTRRDYRAALAKFEQIVNLAPDFAEGWNKRATAHYMLGNYEKSLSDIERTLALEPRHFGALSGRGLVYMELDDPGRALDSFEAALKIHPHLPGAAANVEALREELEGREI